MKKIKNIISDSREKYRLKDEENIKSDFKVSERKGKLWLTHLGIAFREIEDDMPSSEIARLLNEARQKAIEYERL